MTRLSNRKPGRDPTNKKSQDQFFWKYLKILEASSYDLINMTKFWLEHDQNVLQQTLILEHDRQIHIDKH